MGGAPASTGGFGDPPQNFSDDTPAAGFTKYHGIVFTIFRFQHVQSVVTAKTGNAQSLLVAGRHYELAVKLLAFRLKGIHGQDVSLPDKRFHRVTGHAEQAGVRRIRAPANRCADHFSSRDGAQAATISRSPERAHRSLEQRQAYDLRKMCRIGRLRAGASQFEPRCIRTSFTRSRAESLHHFCGLNARHFPEEPCLRLAPEIPELDEMLG